MKRRKFTALFVCIILCALIGASSVFVIVGAHHDCEGSGCTVCLEIRMCEAVLRNLAGGASSAAAVVSVALFATAATIPLYFVTEVKATPVSLRVKLSD